MLIDKVCKSWYSQARGLMFSPKMTLLFVFDKEMNVTLHNFFVFFPINLIFLDMHKKVVEVKRDFKPFTFYRSRKKAKYLIETPYNVHAKIGQIYKQKEIAS